jgi:short-subunit dehydrogenase
VAGELQTVKIKMKWAIIAGGSKGIGYSIAEALAKRKHHLLLIARNDSDLNEAKENLGKKFQVQVEILCCDLSSPESAARISAWCSAKKTEINILCNAAGLGGSKDFPDLSEGELRSMVRTNVESPLTLMLTLLPVLKKNAPSYILNVGSMAGFAPIPIKSVYSSTKSALHFFSYSLRYMLKENKISVSCLCPGPVFTKTSIKEETKKQLGWLGSQLAIEPALVGELAVRGMFKRKLVIVPGRLAVMISCLLRRLPGPWAARMYHALGKKK